MMLIEYLWNDSFKVTRVLMFLLQNKDGVVEVHFHDENLSGMRIVDRRMIGHIFR